MKEQHEEDPGLITLIKEYVKIRKELAMLTIAEKASETFASVISTGVLIILGLLIFFFGSLGLGFYLSELIGNSYSGFFIITAFYLLLAIVVFVIKQKRIEQPVTNMVIKKIFKERNEGMYEKQD